MPTYEYACLSCERHFEVYQSFSDEPLRTCEVCGGPLRRIFHPVGILLKGSGFYSTDNRSSKRRGTDAKKETASEPTSEKKTETKTESKPASSGSSDKSSGDKGSSKKSS
jgi:putative FmdB family regulatory protein